MRISDAGYTTLVLMAFLLVAAIGRRNAADALRIALIYIYRKMGVHSQQEFIDRLYHTSDWRNLQSPS